MSTLAWILAPVVVIALVVAVALRVTERRGVPASTADLSRPWWGRPLLWLGVAATSAVLGLVVAPRIFGFTFLFLPFVWIGGTGRRTAERG